MNIFHHKSERDSIVNRIKKVAIKEPHLTGKQLMERFGVSSGVVRAALAEIGRKPGRTEYLYARDFEGKKIKKAIKRKTKQRNWGNKGVTI